MCGIWSLIHKNTKIDITQLLSDFWNLKHRGPDNSHFETFGNLNVGFHRLAVMDTSFQSNQPYLLQEKDRTIVFLCNGEIYNYKELDKEYDLNVGTSDCLVIPKLYSKLVKFNKDPNKWLDLFRDYNIKGEFAFMLFEFDHTKKLNRYFIGRDSIGVRPLYQSVDNSDIDMYSSEIKGMLNYNKKVEEFPPGHIKVVSCNIFDYSTSWIDFVDKLIYDNHLLKLADDAIFSSTNVCQNIRDSVCNSIKRRLDADRPIAFLLSGGVDSSLVAAIGAKYIGEPIRTFCCGIKGSTDLKYARMVADHIGSNHTEVYFTEEEGLAAIEDVIHTTETWDTTTVRASVGQYMVSKYIGENTDCKVVMVGEGPDEVCNSYLFNFYCPKDKIHETAQEYVQNIHMYDGRRADRCVSRWGLEARVPFLDLEFISSYWSLPEKERHPLTYKFEKYWLRKAFDGLDLLPNEILWRKKEAFSDGVSSKQKSWHTVIQEYVEKEFDHDSYIDVYQDNKPVTTEAKFYRQIFNRKFGILRDDIIPHYWLPKYDKQGIEITKYVDPSARTLDIYGEE